MSELVDLLDYEKIISKIGRFTPIPIYTTLFWLNQSSILYITLLVISILLSVINIALKREFFAKYDIKEDSKVIIFNEEFLNKFRKEEVKPFLIKTLFRYLFFLNLLVSIVFALLSLRDEFNLLMLIFVIIATSSFLLDSIMTILSMKSIKLLAKKLKKK